MKNERNNLNGLLSKLAIGATIALGVTDLSSCNTNLSGFGGKYYGPGEHPEISELTRPGIRQRDGSIVRNYSRDPIVQNKLKIALKTSVSPQNIIYGPDGTILDLKSFTRLPDGRVVITYYDH